jgi:hypothetical protein
MAIRGEIGTGEVELATIGVFDYLEIERPAGEWREFIAAPVQKLGCPKHTPVSMTRYLDGREMRTDECKPEKVPSLHALES